MTSASAIKGIALAGILSVFTLLLSSCGGRDNTVTRVSIQPGMSVSIYGILRHTPQEPCTFSTGCGPEFSLLNETLDTVTPLKGRFKPEHNGYLVEIEGKYARIDKDDQEFLARSGSSLAIRVKRYRLVSEFDYHSFLVTQAEAHTTRKFGCSVLWDKSFSWQVTNERPQLVVTMTDTYSSSRQRPFLKLTFDGVSGHLLEEILQPIDARPCG